MKKALVFGASGFIGSHLLKELLSSPDYSRVTAVVRRPIENADAKLKVLIGDFRTFLNLKDQIAADEVFIALGTTRKHTPDQDEYYRIDHDYPVLAAKIAKEMGAQSVFILTAVGADADSHFFYIKTKGEIERDIRALDFQHTHIFRPSMIMGDRQEKRPMEKIFIKAFSLIDPILMGGMNRYRGIDGKAIAKAMVSAARHQKEKLRIYEWRDMKNLL